MVKDLWDAVYTAFEMQNDKRFKPMFGIQNSKNDIQFRIMKNLGILQKDSANSAAANAIEADVMLSETLGIFSTNDAGRLLDLLQGISRKG